MRRIALALAVVALSGCSLPTPPTSSPIRFADRASDAGLHHRWSIPGKRPLNILQSIGNGCAFLDYNRDGNLDILLVGQPCALYKGDGKGHFTDVSAETGIRAIKGDFLGVAVGDYDNDGYPDLYLTAYNGGALLHNEAGSGAGGRGRYPIPNADTGRSPTPDPRPRRFADITQQAGIAPQPWGTSAAFGDVDGDGFLDLYVANYVRFKPGGNLDLCPIHGENGKTVLGSCPPPLYPPLKGVLYRNIGGERFADVTATWGLNRHTGNGLGVAFADYDSSGRLGLAVANDSVASDLFQNVGGKRFENIGERSGVAANAEGKVYAGMGLDWGDYDNDGRLDLLMTAFENQSKPLYHNEGGGVFADNGIVSGLAPPMTAAMPFGCKWADFDNDSDLDVIYANGHVQSEIAVVNPAQSYRQRLAVFQNDGKGRFTDISAPSGVSALPPLVGRGLATGDYDNDGRVDVLIVDSEGEPLLLHNETKVESRKSKVGEEGHWLDVALRGVKSPCDAYGAIITLTAGGRTFTRHCHADGSYLSSSSPVVHFGLGPAATIDKLVVRWPSGLRESFPAPPVDRRYAIREGKGKTVQQ